MTKRKQDLLELLARTEGMEVMEMLEEATYDGICPGICEECYETREVEPDCADGFCENCGSNKVTSALMLAGII